MIDTTLCYLERGGAWLMLHRVKKKNDINEGKWIGVGGKCEPGETPEQCVRREVFEETGLVLGRAEYRGIVDFCSNLCEEERMYLYTSSDFEGKIPVMPDGSLEERCPEGVLRWVPVREVESLRLWEGDRIFLRYLREGRPFFHIRLEYRGDELTVVKDLLGEPETAGEKD
ncbi:NUDIX hydrolase [Lachnoclostridium sp. Marseille-P6806]|uniref:NUDIX hydrolase n=1 Tax=Lachnoclostridium sp. Marseille-P6806 TaxID=2364793 RepID=UPI00103046D7|nr:8-oxo-dGTP diphosphatase [Lachnoclostridium sp. Marseille-P6806]